jgi:hypothetical protein
LKQTLAPLPALADAAIVAHHPHHDRALDVAKSLLLFFFSDSFSRMLLTPSVPYAGRRSVRSRYASIRIDQPSPIANSLVFVRTMRGFTAGGGTTGGTSTMAIAVPVAWATLSVFGLRRLASTRLTR